MVVALYRDEDEDYALVCFGSTTVAVARWRYEENKHYKVPYSELPTRAEYERRTAPSAAA